MNIKSLLRKFLSAALAGLIACSCVVVSADEGAEPSISETRQVMPDEPEYGEFISDYVRRIIEYLSVYAKEGTSQTSFYKAGLLTVLENHPELYEEVMTAVLGSIDQYSIFYDGGEFEEFISTLESSVGGIGIVISENEDTLYVGSVLENTPASRAGIKAGDILYSADGVSLGGVTVNAAQNAIRGSVGSELTLGVIRDGEPDVIYFTLVREEIGTVESVSYKIFDSEELDDIDNASADKNDLTNQANQANQTNQAVMYIKIYAFMDNAAEMFEKAIEEADSKNINNIIIDVRDNGGGYVDQAVQIANFFLPEGSIIVTEDHKVDLFDIVYKSDNKREKKNDVVILTNGNSASASEILTAALMENEAAVSIGEKTYGKGTVQSMMALKDDEAIKYTAAYYLTPLGNNIDGIGITPDAVVTNGSDPFDMSGYPDFNYAEVFSHGDSSEEVAKAKRILSVWGMYAGDTGGTYFDNELEYAVAEFQAQESLFPYGVLDITTQRRMYEALSETTVMRDDQLEAAFNHFGKTGKTVKE